MAVVAANQAIVDASLDTQVDASVRYGASIGVGIGAIEYCYESSLILHEKGFKRVSPFFLPYTIANMGAGMVANYFNLRGPNICPTTACTSGTHGIGEGWLYIRNNMADVMVCGGVESALCKLAVVSFANMKALSQNNDNPAQASRPFDLNRDGFVFGEGAGILVLEELNHALRRKAKIYAEVVGYGMSGDAHHITAPAPEGEGARRCMGSALESGGIPMDEVDYINAHGTSTKLNDAYETMAIRNLFGSHADRIAVSSTKGVTGHCLGAAGGIEGVFTTMAIHQQVAPPTANLYQLDPECDLDYVPLKSRPMNIRYALSNSFGFGGTNGSIAMKRYEG
jgi:3-oxoacyl-[acyl-carrier-protein] synthase II